MNDTLPTPPSSPQSHAVNSTHSNIDTPMHTQGITPNGMDIDSNEADINNSASPKQNLSHLSTKGHLNKDVNTMTALPLNPTLHGHSHSQALTPLGSYPYPPPTASQSSSPSRGSNLLHAALPDLSAHHPLNSILSNQSGLYSPTQRHLAPVHHTHDHHHHHHIAPPFMTTLYPPFSHPTIVGANPYMPAIDVSSSSNTKLSSITMPTIDNDNNNNHNVNHNSTNLTKKQTLKTISDSNSSSSSSSSSSTHIIINNHNKEKRKKQTTSDVIAQDDDDDASSNSVSSVDNDDGDSDYQNPEEIMSESSENVQIKKRFRKNMKNNKTKTPQKSTRKRKRKRHKLMIESESPDVDEDEDEYSDYDCEKSLSGIWVVYYSWDIIRDTDMTKPRYEMELKQHKGGNIEGKCIEDSGPAAWTFLLTGKLEKNKTFKYTMYGEDDEIFGKATFDGKDIIKNGMWYRDRLYLRKGGALVAARKGTQLPRSLMQKTDIKKMAKRKRESSSSSKRRDNLYSPPSKKQKKNNSRSVSPSKQSRQSLPTPPPQRRPSVSPKQQQQQM